jgi:hypothetical protein
MRSKSLIFAISLLALPFVTVVNSAPVESLSIGDSCSFFYCPQSPKLPPRE